MEKAKKRGIIIIALLTIIICLQCILIKQTNDTYLLMTQIGTNLYERLETFSIHQNEILRRVREMDDDK